MSFTIKCNECGAERTLKDEDIVNHGNISFDAIPLRSFGEFELQSLWIRCEVCNELVDMQGQ